MTRWLYFSSLFRPRKRLRLRMIVISMSECSREYLRKRMRDHYQVFVLVTYVRGSVLLRHVDDRPHRLSAGRGWRECTARTKCNLRLSCCSVAV